MPDNYETLSDSLVEARVLAIGDEEWKEMDVLSNALSMLSSPGEWRGGDVIGLTDDGHEVFNMPHILYADPVYRFESLWYEMNLAVPYHELLARRPAPLAIDDFAWIQAASVADIVRFGTAIIRGERFNEGLLAEAVSKGAILAVIERIRNWRVDSPLRE